MANTYTQFYYHIVFAVRYRESLITKSIKDDLYRYITGIVQGQGQILIAINGMPDHIHLLVACKASIRLSDLVKEVKEHSSRFINEKRCIRGKFYWQAGFGAFSVSRRELDRVIKYIDEQEQHHGKTKFREEYIKILHDNEVVFAEKYLFDFDLAG